MKKLFVALTILSVLAGCKNSKALLPNISGKAGEVIVVIEKNDWEGAPGIGVRELLGCECPYLAQKEPLYSLVQVTPGGFADIFKVHRNILMVNVRQSADTVAVIYRQDVWAAPQCVVQLNARSQEEAVALLESDGKKISGSFEQAERDRVIRNCKLYEEKDLTKKVSEVFGGSPHFPIGYKAKKLTENFAWIADEKQHTMQGIFVYRCPAEEGEPLSMDRIIERRNEVLKEHVPGMFDGTYMTTSDFFPPILEYVRFRGREFALLRGYWEVYNDYMGGPFASQSFYDKDGNIIVAEAFVYAPKFDKRQLMRQVESILWSWEWNVEE